MSNGLVVEGGGMRGIFAAGVLDRFLEKGIRFDNVIGVSMGACIACNYATGQKGRAYATTTDYIGNPNYCSFTSLRKTGDLFNVEFIYHKIPEELYPIDNEAFKKSGIRFQAVVTNAVTGKAEYPEIHDMYDDIEYVRASSSLPMLARMVPIRGGVYMDGGIADSIPLAQSIRQGNEKTVVVLTRPRDYEKNPVQPLMPILKARYRRYPALVEAIHRRNREYNKTLAYVKEQEALGKAFVIAPMGPLNIGRAEMDRDKMKKAYEEGYFVAEGLEQKLLEYLNEA